MERGDENRHDEEEQEEDKNTRKPELTCWDTQLLPQACYSRLSGSR